MQLSAMISLPIWDCSTLYDRYFIHDQQRRLKTPANLLDARCYGISSLQKERRNERAIEYDVLSKFLFVSSTPILFN